MSAPGLSLVLPVYNEARVLDGTLEKLIPFLEGLGRSFELVCVDDGSSDDSRAILDRWAQGEPRLKVHANPENQGKGAAVRRGVLAAEGELVLFMDVDLSTPLEEMPGFLGALDSGYEVVLGNRRSPGSRVTRRQPFLRETLGRAFTLATRTFLAPGVQDFTCGFKGFRREAARSIFSRSTLDGWVFDAELVVIAQEQGHKLVQVPVGWHHEDDTKVRLFSAVLGSLGELAVLWWRRLSGKYR